MNDQSDLGLGHFEAMLMLQALCHIPLSVPEHFLWYPSMHCPVGGPTFIGVCRCHGAHFWTSRVFVDSQMVFVFVKWHQLDQGFHSKILP